MKFLVFIADGFEEVEALTVVDYLRRMDIDVKMVSISDSKEVKGAHGIKVQTNMMISEVNHKDYIGLTIPGGMPGATNLRDNEKVIEIVKNMNEDGKLISAICAGPIVLERAGIIKDKNVTSYPGFEEELSDSNYLEENVVVDKNIITARGPAIATDFALNIVEYLLDKSKREELEEDILFHLL